MTVTGACAEGMEVWRYYKKAEYMGEQAPTDVKVPQSLTTATRWTSWGQKGPLEINVPTLWLRILVMQWIV